MKDHSHYKNEAAFVKWLFSQPELPRRQILEAIYPNIKDAVSGIMFHHLLNDRIPSFAPAINQYIVDTRGTTYSADKLRVEVVTKSVEDVTCMAVEEEPDITADKLLHLFKHAVHDFTEAFLNMTDEDFEGMLGDVRSEYKHQQ